MYSVYCRIGASQNTADGVNYLNITSLNEDGNPVKIFPVILQLLNSVNITQEQTKNGLAIMGHDVIMTILQTAIDHASKVLIRYIQQGERYCIISAQIML